MRVYALIFSITIVMQSYILTYKYYENKKTIFYFPNIFILLINFTFFFIYVSTKIHDLIDNKIIIFCMFLILMNVISLIIWTYNKRKSIGKIIIKKTIDSSESGLIVLKNKDKVLFQNIIMYNIIEKLDIKDNYVKNIIDRSVRKIGNDYVILVNDKAWLFCISDDRLEITAFDIDEEYKLHIELERQNEEINKNNEKLLWTIENLEEIEKEEKSLRIKNKFHDLLGQNLAILKMYLNQDIYDNKKFNDVKFMIKKMFTQLEDTNNPEVDLMNLIKINENIGIKINLEGKLPKEKEKAKVIFEVIREAVTNAIKHANSTKINVKIEDRVSGLFVLITNDGIKPKETIVESEGIKGMRRKVKMVNGNIFIKTVPEFSIQINL